jgi:hypothetical protein
MAKVSYLEGRCRRGTMREAVELLPHDVDNRFSVAAIGGVLLVGHLLVSRPRTPLQTSALALRPE